jgi:hypothetical protein
MKKTRKNELVLLYILFEKRIASHNLLAVIADSTI